MRGAVAAGGTLVAQSNRDSSEGERIGNSKHGVAGSTGEYAELESGGEDLRARRDERGGMVAAREGTLRMFEISTKSAAPKASSNMMCWGLTAGGTCKTFAKYHKF